MFPPYTLNGRDQQLRIRLHPQTAYAGDIDGVLANGHGLHESGFGIDHRAPQQLRFSSVADVRTELRKFGYRDVINLVVDDHRLFRGTNGSVVESFGGDDIHDGHVELRGLFQINRRIAGTHTQGRLA